MDAGLRETFSREAKDFCVYLNVKTWLGQMKNGPRLPGLLATLLLASLYCVPSFGAQNRALLIGISQYTELNSLRYADADVLAFSQLLTDFGGYNKSDVDMLLNQQATKAQIVAAVNKIITESQKKPIDQFVLMFAGHGVPGQLNNKNTSIFLAPSDASTNANNFYSTGDEVVNETFISKAWLARQLSAINAKSILIILDSCYSGTRDFGKLFLENEGYSVESFGTEGAHNGVAVVQRNLAVSRNRGISQGGNAVASQVAYFASSRDDQPSAEYDELQHGALSYSIFQYIRSVQRNVYTDERKDLTVDDVYSNVTKLFHEVKVEGKTLDQVNQPILMAVPDFAAIKNMDFISVQGVRKREEIKPVEPGFLEINTEPENAEISVDGVKRPELTNARLSLPEGKHVIELFLPNTSYRYSFTADIVPSQTVKEDFNMRGTLEVASFWLKDGNKTPGPPLDVYIDGSDVGRSDLRLDNLLAGAHVLEVHYQNLSKQRRIEIRPDSPLRVNYSIIREAAPAKKPDNGVGNVVF
jgi:Caspase domain